MIEAWQALARRQSDEIVGPTENRGAKIFGSSERSGNDGLVIAGDESLGPSGWSLRQDAMRHEMRFEEGPRRGLRLRRIVERPAADAAQGLGGGQGRPQRSVVAQDRRGMLRKKREGFAMVVIAEAGEIGKAERSESGRLRADAGARGRRFAHAFCPSAGLHGDGPGAIGSVAGLGGDELPIRIARLAVAGEGPDVDHIDRADRDCLR